MTVKTKHPPSKHAVSPINLKRFLIGMGALILGIMVYLIERPHGTFAFIRFLPFDPAFLRQLSGPLKPFAGSLPDLAHIFSFILLTGSLTPQTRAWDVGLCLGWFGVEIAFELAQGYGAEIAAILPHNLADQPIQRQIMAYLRQGTLDPLDLIGIFIGMIAAYWVLYRTRSALSPL